MRDALGLTLAEADLFGTVAPISLPTEFVERVRSGVELALAVNTEKARSEFIIAPLLFEVKRVVGDVGLFSGIEFDVDAARGLNDYCDFILTRSSLQSVLTTPLVAVVEAKNDNLRTGLGQCVAVTVAAREFNARAATPTPAVYGVVTTGGAWKFLRLVGHELALDRREYFVAELDRIFGIFAHILRG